MAPQVEVISLRALLHIVNQFTILIAQQHAELVMWQQSYSQMVSDVTVEEVWNVWTDVNQWHTWQDDIEFARLDVDFKSL